MNAITLRNGKQLDEPKRPHGEKDGGLDLVSENKEQDKHEENTKPRPVEPYRPWFPSLKGLLMPNLRPSLGNF